MQPALCHLAGWLSFPPAMHVPHRLRSLNKGHNDSGNLICKQA